MGRTEPAHNAAVFVVDDEPSALKGVAALVSSMGFRCETFASAEEFLERFDVSRAGCLLIDLRLKGINGLELQERLLARGSTLPVIFISAYADVATTVRAMRNGALTMLEKPYQADELADAIRGALDEDSERRATRVRRAEVRKRLSTLTERETRVMELIVAGKPNKAIARDLALSQRTVDRLRASLFEKMGAGSAVEVTRMVADLQAGSVS
jgi:FixJ family two-component response regulator